MIESPERAIRHGSRPVASSSGDNTMSKMNVVGQSVERPDAYDKVTGGKGYPINVRLPGMLHAKMLRSPYPHARIISIDASRAEKLPGVRAVLLPKDVPQVKFTPVFFVPVQAPSMVLDFEVMNGEIVRYVGQPVAAVAATTAEIAEAALDLIDIEYEPLPAVFDPEEAMKDGAPQLHAEAANNIAKNPSFECGDLAKGFAKPTSFSRASTKPSAPTPAIWNRASAWLIWIVRTMSLSMSPPSIFSVRAKSWLLPSAFRKARSRSSSRLISVVALVANSS